MRTDPYTHTHTDTLTPEEVRETHRAALKALEALNLQAGLYAIGERLALGQWLEAVELAARFKIAPRAPLTLAHHLADATRAPAPAPQVWIEHARALIEASERGVVVREELEEEARALGRWGDIHATITGTNQKQRAITRPTRPRPAASPARGARARTREEGAEEGAEPLAPGGDDPRAYEEHAAGAVVRIASPRDLDARREALAELAQHIRAELPPPPYDLGRKGNPNKAPETRAAWVAWADEVARRWPAPLRASDLYQVSGERAPVAWLAGIITEREELAARGLTEERRRALASTLLDESEAIAREALALAAGGVDERARLAGLKLALDSIAQRARLAGVERVNLSVETATTSAGGTLADKAQALGLTPEALRAIGDAASTALSAAKPTEDS